MLLNPPTLTRGNEESGGLESLELGYIKGSLCLTL